jgi:hypothetical protein
MFNDCDLFLEARQIYCPGVLLCERRATEQNHKSFLKCTQIPYNNTRLQRTQWIFDTARDP